MKKKYTMIHMMNEWKDEINEKKNKSKIRTTQIPTIHMNDSKKWKWQGWDSRIGSRNQRNSTMARGKANNANEWWLDI